MPKQTFLNLPKEKQETILNASIMEFSRVPLSEASINKIIQNSGIPRGSFYMYFDNKEELYYFLLEKYFEFIIDNKIQLIKKCNGDIIATYIKLFDILYKESNKVGRRDFFKNVFLNLSYKIENDMNDKKDFMREKSKLFYEEVDTRSLNVKSSVDLFYIDNLFMSILKQSMFETFVMPDKLKDIKKKYLVQIALMKNGVYIKEDNNA